MKQIVIEIDDEVYEGVTGDTTFRDYEREALTAIRKGTVLPNNPTNGDMIKALFPMFVESEKNYDAVEINFKNDWWNAPYKAESEEQDE